MVIVIQSGNGLARNVIVDIAVFHEAQVEKGRAMTPQSRQHHLGRAVPGRSVPGQPVPGWAPATPPDGCILEGSFCRLVPLMADPAGDDSVDYAAGLLAAFQTDADGAIWDYLPYGPFDDLPSFNAFLDAQCRGSDPHFYVILDAEGAVPLGMASYLRITPEHGVIEVGHINYSPALQRSVAATEAMYLMMRQVFDVWGYRRYEWKCNNLNAASKAAAQRLGFTFEGVFRQAAVVKGHNRDTAWFSIIDSEWPALRRAFEEWLAPANFAADGSQLTRLGLLRAPG